MFGIKIKNTFLKLYPKTTFGFELSSAAYLGDAVNEIANGLVFSTKIPLTGENVKLLRYPHLVENEWRFLKDEYVEIWKNGRIVFMGELTVTKATPQYDRELYADVSIVVNTVGKLKDLKMSDTEMGQIPTANIVAHAKQTALNPLDFPYIFYPVQNAIFSEAKTVQNKWDGTDFSLFYTNRIGDTHRHETMLTPHLRLDYIQAKIFEHIGFTFYNNWQKTDELRLLTQVGYGGMHTIFNEFLTPQYSLNRALSSTTVSAWIGKLCRIFGLVADINLFNKTANFMLFTDVLNRAAKWDWTEFALRGGNLSESNNYPKSFAFKKADNLVPDISLLPINANFPPFNAEDGLYRVGIDLCYHRKKDDETDLSKPNILVQRDNIANIKGGLEAWEIDISPLPQADLLVPVCPFAPIVEQVGKLPNEDRETPDHWLFYRGMHTYNNHTFPLATSETTAFIPSFKIMGGASPQYDLTWNGENGIFNRFWKANFDFLKEKRDHTVKLALPLDDLIQFNFVDKVRIKNMEYLVKKLRGVLRAEGDLVELEADLVTVV